MSLRIGVSKRFLENERMWDKIGEIRDKSNIPSADINNFFSRLENKQVKFICRRGKSFFVMKEVHVKVEAYVDGRRAKLFGIPPFEEKQREFEAVFHPRIYANYYDEVRALLLNFLGTDDFGVSSETKKVQEIQLDGFPVTLLVVYLTMSLNESTELIF